MSMNQLDSGALSASVAVPPSPPISEEVRAAAERLGVGRYLPEVIGFTLEIFGRLWEARLVPDPEISGDVHIVFDVPASGSVEALLDKDMRWSQRLLATVPRAPRIFAIAMSSEG